MNHELLNCAVAAVAAFAAGAASAFELGAADADVYAAKGSEAVANELSGYLEKVFGKSFPVKPMTKEVASDAAGIFVGARPPGCDVTWDAERECCVRVVEPTRVWLFGNDSGKALHGTDDAVYDFLERFAGVRWLWPGETGTVADPSGPVSLADETSVYVTPFRRRLTNSFTYGSGSRSAEENRELAAWLRHRHVGSSLVGKGGSGFQHAFASLMPRNKYGREHPEYYGLVPPEHWVGEPKPAVPTRQSDPLRWAPWQLCTSNPDVCRIVAEKLISAKSTAIQSISPNDGNGFCECDACRALDPEGQGIGSGPNNITDRIFCFLSNVAWRVYSESPSSKVGLFSYGPYASVPKGKFVLPPNVYLSCCYEVARMNKDQEAALNEKLAGLANLGAQIIGREYWGCHYMLRYPLSHSRKIDRNLKLLHKIGAAGIYGETGVDFAVRATDLNLLARLAWDPSADREAALHDFCDKAFGPEAGKVMYALYEKIEDRVEAMVETHSQNHGVAFEHYGNRYAESKRLMTTIFDADFSDMCDRETKKALNLADTPERRRRVEYVVTGLSFARIQTAALTSFADLASAGCDMPLTQPSGMEVKMEKAALLDLAKKAISAENARRMFSLLHHGENALSPDFRSEALELRPWGVIAQKARLLLLCDRYSYLVNGAFEYSGYSWEVSGNGTNTYTRARNRDADDNWMVQCHGGQGISLELTIEPGGEMTVRNLRKVSPATTVTARLGLFAHCGGEPFADISASLGGVALEAVDVGALLPEEGGWHEMRFRPAEIPAGDHEFALTVKNQGTEPLVVNLDGLSLKLKP